MTIDRDLIEWARLFATEAHGKIDQRRKYTGEPYITHPEAVAAIVASVPHTHEIVAAAWLHDTVEDTGVTIDQVRREFGDVVAELVGWLTDVSKPSDGNRAARKAIDREHSGRAPADAKTVKLADLIDNSRTILQYDPGFARTYIREKRALLPLLREGDATLWARADSIVQQAVLALDIRPEGGKPR